MGSDHERAWRAGGGPAALIATLALAAPVLADSAVGPATDPAGATAEPAALPALESLLDAPPPALDAALFPLPDSLAPNVRFWSRVYTGHDSHHVLLHDNLYVDAIYADVDFSKVDESEGLSAVRKAQIRERELERVRQKYRDILLDLAKGVRDGEDPEDRARVELLLAGVPGGAEKYREAAERLRTQTCLSDRFATAIERSGRYLPLMEEIFRARGLPLELTRLPFVESMFQSGARSKAAAGGIWQFVPGTARYFLTMQLEFDERFDPLRATEAAARLLAANYESLGTWPLALTAYNHGRAGMERAVRQLGSRDLGAIVAGYSSRSFGFASRNFYAEFVAAARVYAERDHHFPAVAPLPALEYAEFVPDRYVALAPLAVAAGLDLGDLETLNPALARDVWSGDLYLPSRYRLLIPPSHAEAIEAAYRGLPPAHKSEHQVGTSYKVKAGDSLGAIARRFGTSVTRLQQANGIRDPRRLRIGQVLRIPPRAGGRPVATR